MNFADTLREKRIAKGISQQELATKAGVSQSEIGYWERGEKIPSIVNANNVAKTLGVSLDEGRL